ncbi:DUF2332 family protein [Microbacterium sp.]|uniref:DUF2332 family protein n=1 Tax=Microbacterium sp. TaxID=51671 RepID=UPI003A8B6496
MDADLVAITERYRRFARDEAPSRSPVYARWAARVSADPPLQRILAAIAPHRRQPPLVFAVARLLGLADDADDDEFADWVRGNGDRLRTECERRSLQTNEPQRCAALLPALGLIDGPIALLEVGASAGLCLYPDRYSYRYVGGDRVVAQLDPADGPSEVTLTCRVRGDRMPPVTLPDVVWRAGIDLNPLDPGAASTAEWLTALVWPGESGRTERIRAALRIAAHEPPHLVAADAAEALPAVAAEAPRGATLVITTPGVLVHLPAQSRSRVITQARRLGRWVTLDAPGLHDGWVPDSVSPWRDGFALAVDGEVRAAADPLGGWVEWRTGERARVG